MLQERLSAWLQLQAGEVVKTGGENGLAEPGIDPDPADGGDAVSKPNTTPVSIQSGTIAEIFTSGVRESFFLELRWMPGISRLGNSVMLSAADIAEGKVPLEVGKPAELPGSEVGPPGFELLFAINYPSYFLRPQGGD